MSVRVLKKDSVAKQVAMTCPKTGVGVAIKDIADGLVKYRLALVFGWQDVAQRYRRSRVGAFWLTINMAVFIGALGLIFGTLFQSEMREFLPYLCAGVIMWGFISTTLSEGCSAFSGSDGIILQVRMPLFVHVMRVLWRNIIIMGHNIVIFPVIALIMGRSINLNIIWVLPGFLLVSLNIAWMVLVLGIVCARFRDMMQVMTNILQVLFYATPIMWTVKVLPEHVSRAFIEWNPFYHFIELVRAPLLGSAPTLLNWLFPVCLMVIGWAFAVVFYGKYRWRVAYWL
ncbi:ABC transporter permease [Brucella sp. 10RB9213]|uniref:ABC transporter permease n=1 Tax=Brucella sp. 10RB9213 TaxID=1844039 RepID=UPI0012AE8A43|nr:ABC transporter permease [Brucella sp. 10RB9213]MRN67105.1 ABC transporter permease [Brucella sp. 10RB9213]